MINHSKLVSIIIPVYNVDQYLSKCLDSVIHQTYHNLEIICVNDASSDNSLEILKEYASEDNRIKILNNAHNKGLASSRNIALKAVRGDFVLFVDSDDWIDVDTIEHCVENIKRTRADFIAFGLV